MFQVQARNDHFEKQSSENQIRAHPCGKYSSAHFVSLVFWQDFQLLSYLTLSSADLLQTDPPLFSPLPQRIFPAEHISRKRGGKGKGIYFPPFLTQPRMRMRVGRNTAFGHTCSPMSPAFFLSSESQLESSFADFSAFKLESSKVSPAIREALD